MDEIKVDTKVIKKPWYKKDIVFYAGLVLIFTTFFLTQKYIVYFPRVSGNSMMNTMEDGDFFVCKRVYNIEEIERFDIVTIRTKDGIQIVKRVIGLPNEEVYIDENGCIYINGVLLEENYGKEQIKDVGLAKNSIVLGKDEFFILGDNRNDSLDSRFEKIGNIKFDAFLGKAIWYKNHTK